MAHVPTISTPVQYTLFQYCSVMLLSFESETLRLQSKVKAADFWNFVFEMSLKSCLTHENITSYCPHKTKKKGNLTGQWCLSPWQPQGVRRRSYFGVNVARFVGRQCGGDTTQGVTPPHPPLSLDLLSGTPCMEQGILPGMSMLPGGALFCPPSTRVCVFCSAWHQARHYLWLDECLHSACDVFRPPFLKTSLFSFCYHTI